MGTIADLDRSLEVVASAAAGDEVAFPRIVAAYHDDMVRVAYLVTAEVDLALDAVQSAWPIAWRKLPTLRDRGLLRPWLVSIAANEARGLLRKRRRRHLTEITVEAWDEVSSRRAPGWRIAIAASTCGTRSSAWTRRIGAWSRCATC